MKPITPFQFLIACPHFSGSQGWLKQLLLSMLLVVGVSVSSSAQQHTFTGFAPSAAFAGETLTLTGTNFTGVTAVTIGGVAAASFTVVSPTVITAVVAVGASNGSVTVTKPSESIQTRTVSGFIYSAVPHVTRVVTDFGGFWNSNSTSPNPVMPDSSHILLAFTYMGTTYSTGVKDNTLIAKGVNFTVGRWRGFPAILSGNTSGTSLLIATGARNDGSMNTALFNHPNIKDLTLQSVLSDGLGGLDLGTGYTNLPTTAASSFNIFNAVPSKVSDAEPDIIITQIASPDANGIDVYEFLDADSNRVGIAINKSIAAVPRLGTWLLDLFAVPNAVPVATAKPTGVWTNGTMTTRDIRLAAFKLSDFGINASNVSQVRFFKISPSGNSDVAFVAYNADAINLPPSVAINVTATNSAVCTSGGNAYLSVIAIPAGNGVLSYQWEVSTDNGSTWNTISDNSTYSGSTTNGLSITGATPGYLYRVKVTESISNFTSTSSNVTITALPGTPLAGTLDPATSVNNCLGSVTGVTSLSVAPTGGIGSYSYQWLSSTSLAGPYTPIPGAIYNTYNFDVSTAGTTYYKVAITSGCYSHLSTASTVVITGETITSVTNGVTCSPGAVTLSATASGGTINWYANNITNTPLVSGATYSPTVSSTTTYFVATSSGGCLSVRVPVTATVANAINLDSNNTKITFATNVCSGSGSTVSVLAANLINGTYTINYNVTGANTITNATATLTVTNGNASFVTAPLNNVGTSSVSISSVTVGACARPVTNPNSYTINVSSGAPNASNFSLSVANSCNNVNPVATVSSSTLATGSYAVTFNVTGDNTVPSTTAVLNFTAGTPGTGTFVLPLLGNAGSNNVLTITSISLSTSLSCATPLTTVSAPFTNSLQPLVDPGLNRTICPFAVASNIGAGASATNFSALSWSTPDGTGTFGNNTTVDALTNTTYTPSAADIAAGLRQLTLTATGNAGCGTTSRTIDLHIGCLRITTQPQLQYACLGYMSKFTVVASPSVVGNPLTYQWRKGDVNITGATNATYQINAVAPADTGSVSTNAYDVVVTEPAMGVSVISELAPLIMNKQAIFTGGSSDWNTPGNWNTNAVPDSPIHAYIPASLSNYPNITSGVAKCKCITIENGATVTVNGGTLEIAGRINNVGNETWGGLLNVVNGSVVMNGNGNSVPQTLWANVFQTNFIKDLKIDNAAGVSLQGPLSLTGVYTPVSTSVFSSNGHLTLKSTAANTARVIEGPSTGGYITGNVTVERYLAAHPGRRWTSMAAPVTQRIDSAWQQDIYVTGPGTGGFMCAPPYLPSTQPTKHTNGMDATQLNPVSMFTYTNGNWAAITNTNNTNLVPGIGYYVNARGDRNVQGCDLLKFTNSQTATTPTYTVTVKAKGPLTQGNFNLQANNLNFFFVGNPYASELSFNSFYTANSAKMQQKYWLFMPKNLDGNYMTWDGTNHAGAPTGYTNFDRIASGQSFFINVVPQSLPVTFNFTESMKVNARQEGGFKTTTVGEKIRINLYVATDSNKQDDALVVFDQTTPANNNITTDIDSRSINTGAAWVATLKGTEKLAIHKRNGNYTSDTVGIFLHAAVPGGYSFQFTELGTITYSSVYLLDNVTNTLHNVLQSPSYTFNVATGGSIANRFSLIFNANPLSATSLEFTANNVDDYAHLEWTVREAADRASYEVQSSDDGVSYKAVGTKTAVNETNGATYRFVDEEQLKARRYYRIKAYHNDGKATFSRTKTLMAGVRGGFNFGISPNPVRDNLYITFMGEEKATRVKIYDATGKLVQEQSTDGSDLTINTSQLSSGAYMVEVTTTQGSKQVQKFIK